MQNLNKKKLISIKSKLWYKFFEAIDLKTSEALELQFLTGVG